MNHLTTFVLLVLPQISWTETGIDPATLVKTWQRLHWRAVMLFDPGGLCSSHEEVLKLSGKRGISLSHATNLNWQNSTSNYHYTVILEESSYLSSVAFLKNVRELPPYHVLFISVQKNSGSLFKDQISKLNLTLAFYFLYIQIAFEDMWLCMTFKRLTGEVIQSKLLLNDEENAYKEEYNLQGKCNNITRSITIC